MRKPERKAVIRAIARLHEKAYRRGFHHGVTAYAESPVNEVAVCRWRYSQIQGQTKSPPGIRCRYRCKITTRMSMEGRKEWLTILRAIGESDLKAYVDD